MKVKSADSLGREGEGALGAESPEAPGEGPDLVERRVCVLEDDPESRRSLRSALARSFEIRSVADRETAEAEAVAGCRRFVLDIKLGDGALDRSAGIDTLEALRRQYGASIFVAVWSVAVNEYLAQAEKFSPNLVLEKSPNLNEDAFKIRNAVRSWVPPSLLALEFPTELLPSNDLAVRIAGIADQKLEGMARDRRRLERSGLIGSGTKTGAEQIKEEVGSRLRAEVRGVLSRLLAESSARSVQMTQRGKLTRVLARKLLHVLPIATDVEQHLLQLSQELFVAAGRNFSGTFGQLELRKGDVWLKRTLRR